MSSKSKSQPASFPVPLTRKLLDPSVCPSLKPPSFKIGEDAVKLTAALLKHFVEEAVRRAVIESETSITTRVNDDDDDDDIMPTHQQKKMKVITVLPKHVSAIAADLIMDFC